MQRRHVTGIPQKSTPLLLRATKTLFIGALINKAKPLKINANDIIA